MALEIIRDDITRVDVDVIVNAANETLLGGGGVDGAIHRAAGPELLVYCRTLNGCRTGEAKITPGFQLPCRYVIHTVGPVWRGGAYGERELLAACYANSLALAKENGCRSVAFPLISAGAYGYPAAQALRVATDTIRDFLETNDMQVYIVLFDSRSFRLGSRLYSRIAEYIDDRYADERMEPEYSRRMRAVRTCADSEKAMLPLAEIAPVCGAPMLSKAAVPSLEEALSQLDETFTEMLLRTIDEKGMKDAECYKRANVDRKLFSKIRSDLHYKPSKRTALAFAIALELPLDKTRELLMKAGYALSHSSRFDVIIEYCIREEIYDIDEINEALLGFDQPLLGL